MSEQLPATTLVIFGISGDLSRRYLLPALSEICRSPEISAHLKILGTSRRQLDLSEILPKKPGVLAKILELYQMDPQNPNDYKKLKHKLSEIGGKQVIFYFAVPPDAVLPIIDNLGETGLNSKNVKLLLEKPFGKDLESARKLIGQTQKHFTEDQIYRIDHYLAKEVAQNIAVFLGSNVLFRDVWNNKYIDYIEIVAAEKIGLEGREEFYEQTGALRDIVQSHLLQLAALTLMEPCPNQYDFSDLPHRRYMALKNLAVSTKDISSKIIRAQYEDYRQEVKNPDSTTETFVALQLESKDERWKGVPVYLATGKRLDEKLTQIRVNFDKTNSAEANQLIIRIQPREGIELDLWVKRPGYDKELQKKTLSFSFGQTYDRLPDAYEQVLVDAIRGNHSLFAGSGEVLESWRVLQPVLDHWSRGSDDLKSYEPGSLVSAILP